MQDLIPFNFNDRNVRILIKDGEPWFVAGDVSSVLEYASAKDMTRMLDDDEKGRHSVPTLGGSQEVLVVSEAGLYSCVIRSKKPEAREFKRWITHEVLPSIRKTGSYSARPQLTEKEDTVRAISAMGDFLAKVPGVKPGIAAAATLRTIEVNTGINTEEARKALPAHEGTLCAANATALGRLMGIAARSVNTRLRGAGLQFKNGRNDWELTEEGKKWGEMLPYNRQGHSGYQILWDPDVVKELK